MDYVVEKGFMYARTYGLDAGQIETMINNEVSKLDLPPEEKGFNLEINVVRNKDEYKLGYSFLWIDNLKIFFALLGLNFDGSERKVLIEKGEEDLDDKPLTSNWGEMIDESEVPQYKYLDPLIIFPPLILTEQERVNYRMFADEVDFDIEASKVHYNPDYILKNSIYSKGIPPWLKEAKIKNFFKTFEKDVRKHSTKKGKFSYPIVKIKNGTVNVYFSKSNPNLASFVINMTKKVKFYDENHQKECLVKFKQTKIKRNA